MNNDKYSIQSSFTKKYKKETKISSKGRQIIKPKKLLTTSSDDSKQQRKKRIIKGKCTNMHEEMYELQSCPISQQPNILRDITFASNTQKMKHVTSKTPHKASHVLSRNELMDIHCPLSNNHNEKQLVKQDTTLARLHSNMSVNNKNLKRSVSYGNTSTVLSKSFDGQKKCCEMTKSYTNINALDANISCDDRKRLKMLPTIENSLIDSFISSNKNVQVNNVSNIPEADNCQSVFVDYGANGNTESNKYKMRPTILDVKSVQIPIAIHNVQETESSHEGTQLINNVANIPETDNCQPICENVVHGNTESNKHKMSNKLHEKTLTELDIESIPIVLDYRKANISNSTNQCDIMELLRQVIQQNTEILADMKTLKQHHRLMTQSNLYKKPDGFPLKTVQEFQAVESNNDHLQELLIYLKFIGGIKLREALSHFQKETMTDELTYKFTYWGREGKSLPFYNTQIAKVFFQAAKVCPNFKGPDTRAEFKLEMMEVFRAAKQRQYLKSNKDKRRRVETEETNSEDFSDYDAEMKNSETEILDVSNESD